MKIFFCLSKKYKSLCLYKNW